MGWFKKARSAVTTGKFSPAAMKVVGDNPLQGFRKFSVDSAAYSGIPALGNAMNHTGSYGRVGSAALGVAGPTYALDVASGREKWDNRTAGRRMSAYTAYEDAKYSKKKAAADKEWNAQQAEQSAIEREIENLRAEYGVFDGPAPSGGSASDVARFGLAQDAQRGLGERDANYSRAFAAYFQPGVKQQYFAQDRANRFDQARRGTTGGSTDTADRRLSLGHYLRSSQAVAAGARTAVTNLRTSDQGRRIGQESAIRTSGSGQAGALDWLGGAGLDLSNASIDLPGETAGSAFGAAGSIYGQDQEARGSGRQGLSLYGGSSSNRITPS